MAKKGKKTNVMRILDKEKIDYDTKSYDYTEEDLSGVHAAAALGYGIQDDHYQGRQDRSGCFLPSF